MKTCEIELNNEYLAFCLILNKNPEIIFLKILNRTLPENLEALKQTKDNEQIQNIQTNDPEIQ